MLTSYKQIALQKEVDKLTKENKTLEHVVTMCKADIKQLKEINIGLENMIDDSYAALAESENSFYRGMQILKEGMSE